MSCSKQYSAAVYLKFVKDTTGVEITQSEWHEVRQLAKGAGYDVSRTRTNGADAYSALASLDISTTVTKGRFVGLPADLLANASEELLDPKTLLPKESATKGTVNSINYLASIGVVNVVEGIRDRKAVEKERDAKQNEEIKKFSLALKEKRLERERIELANSGVHPESIKLLLALGFDDQVIAARASGAAPVVMDSLATSSFLGVRRELAMNPALPASAAVLLSKDDNLFVLRDLASNPVIPAMVQLKLAKNNDADVRRCLFHNKNVTPEAVALIDARDEKIGHGYGYSHSKESEYQSDYNISTHPVFIRIVE